MREAPFRDWRGVISEDANGNKIFVSVLLQLKRPKAFNDWHYNTFFSLYQAV
jgi:hypothetical protein